MKYAVGFLFVFLLGFLGDCHARKFHGLPSSKKDIIAKTIYKTSIKSDYHTEKLNANGLSSSKKDIVANTNGIKSEVIVGNVKTMLMRGKLIAQIPKLDKEHLISFEVYPNKFEPGFHSLIHFTIGSDYKKYGDRVPGIWFLDNGKGGLAVGAPINGDKNRFITTKPLALKMWTNIEISQSLKGLVYVYTVKVNGEVVFSETNNQVQSFQNVKVYASDPWYAAQDGIIRNLYVINGISNSANQPITIFNPEFIVGNYATTLLNGKLIAEIPKLDKEHLISFEVYPNKFEPGFHSLIHFTIGSDYEKYGDRVPGIWFLDDGKGGLAVGAPINGDKNRFITTKPLALKMWTNIEISQSLKGLVYVYTVKVNGEVAFFETNNQVQSFQNVKVYASDPWYAAQDGIIRNLYVINGISNGSNQPITIFTPDFIVGDVATKLMKGKLVAEIPRLDKEHLISFEVYPNKFEPGFHSLIHFTIGTDYEKYGDRVPGIWFLDNGKGGLAVGAPINGDKNRFVTTKPLALKMWTNIEISQSLKGSVYMYTVKVNGEVVFSETNNQVQSFENVKVYASDPWYEAQDGVIRNLFVTNIVSMSVHEFDDMPLIHGTKIKMAL